MSLSSTQTITPLHHVVVNYPVSSKQMKTMRVVLTREGPLEILMAYFAEIGISKSESWRDNTARAIGLLYDFTVQTADLYPFGDNNNIEILSDFARALQYGTIQSDGSDHTGLFWPSQGAVSVTTNIYVITEFSDYCVYRFGMKPYNPKNRKPNFAEKIAMYRKWDHRNRNSFLRHLNKKGDWKEEKVRAVTTGYAQPVKKNPPKSFPPEYFNKLILEGFVARGTSSVSPFHIRNQLRDAMIAILQGAAGFRKSEPFHLFVDDIIENPHKPGHAYVRIHHPEQGRVMARDLSDPKQKIKSFKRSDFLESIGYRSQRSLSRTERSGWKSPAVKTDAESKSLYMEAYFFPPIWGKIFWDYYKAYLHIRAQFRPVHPFLFVSTRGATSGEPYKNNQYDKKLRIAVKRIGLIPKKSFGTTSHGLRHMYGYNLRRAGVDLEMRKDCMHHKSIESTLQYGLPDSGEVFDTLEEAHKSLRDDSAPMLEQYALGIEND